MITSYTTGESLAQALIDAGIVPPDCGDILIKIPVFGPVEIHTKFWVKESHLKVIDAAIRECKIVDRPKRKRKAKK